MWPWIKKQTRFINRVGSTLSTNRHMDIVAHSSHHAPRSLACILLYDSGVCILRLLVVVVSLKKYAAHPLLYMSDKKDNTAVSTGI